MQQNYSPQESEDKWRMYWLKEKVYTFNLQSKKKIFSIDTPPPTVSGQMHVGHSFSYSQEDFIVRYKRMVGLEVFFPFGTDDNGLATERLVERLKNVKSKKMERKEFVKLCLLTLEEIRSDFVNDWKKLGISCDYSLFYSTIDSHCQKVSQKSFIELYKKGLEYRKFAPIIFCPECKTVIAQVEMEDKEEQSTLNFIKAELEDHSYVIYATTRPELLYACVGMSIDEKGDYVRVYVNKEKWIVSKEALEKIGKWTSYKILEEFKGKELLGKNVTIPISQNIVPLTHDNATETKYGTGIVYYCTYGGLECVEWMVRHQGVEAIHVMNLLDGRYNGKSGILKGLHSLDARRLILEELQKNNTLVHKDPIKHIVNVHERCGTAIEYVATEQWFIKYLDKKELIQKAGNTLHWYPPHMKNRFDNWIKGLQWDWCISRQRHFGTPIPVWYCKKCSAIMLPEEEELPIDPIEDTPSKLCVCGSKEFVPEKDVLDTWATSSLTPEIAASLVPKVYDKVYPMSLRQNSHDIITFWLFNTVVKSQLHSQQNPWKDVMITGWVLDPHGRKMSKSKGNVIDPREVWTKYSVDALRFAAAGTKLGEDYPFQEKDVVTGQKTVRKLWNAAKFSFSHLEDFKEKPKKVEGFDAWILSKLNYLIKDCTENFEKYEYSRVKSETEKFFRIIFCDAYLEIVKDRLYNPNTRGKEARVSGQYTLSTTLLEVLKLFAPIMPYITEEIYHMYYAEKEKKKSIHLSSWPEYIPARSQRDKEEMGDKLVEIISEVRKAKSAKSLSLKEQVKVLTLPFAEKDVAPFIADLKAVTQAETIQFGKTLDIEL